MQTIIDELIVTLGLDPKNFNKGQKEAATAFATTKLEAKKAGDEIEHSNKNVGQSFSALQTRVLGLLALFMGGKSIKNFTEEMTKLGAETGRSANLIGSTASMLSTWRGAAVVAGGTAAGITSSMKGLVHQFQMFSLTGESSVIPYFRALNVSISDSSGRMRKMDDIFLDLSDRFSKMDPAKAAAFGSALGFDEGTVNLLLKGPVALGKMIEQQKQLTQITDEDAKAAAELERQWTLLQQTLEKSGRTMVTAVTPALTTVLKVLRQAASDPMSFLTPATGGRSTAESLAEISSGGFFIPDSAPSAPAAAPAAGRPAASPATSGDLRVKPGAGTTSLATAALARSIQSEVPGVDRFTAFNDPYHQFLGGGSAHSRGQALDFTVKDAAQSEMIAAQIRKKLSDMGVDARVIDEYKNPSKGSTGGHIHVQFSSADAAQKYTDLASNAGRSAQAGDVNNRTSTSTSDVKINKIEINTQATDARGIAAEIGPAIQGSGLAAQANVGPQ